MHGYILRDARGRSVNNFDVSNTMEHPSAGDLPIWARLRRGLLVTIGCGCLILGAVLIVTMVRPETLQSLGTLELAAIVGFVVMPALTLLSIRYDRLVVRRVKATGCEQIAMQALITHPARTRGTRVVHHARLNEDTKKSRDPVEAA